MPWNVTHPLKALFLCKNKKTVNIECVGVVIPRQLCRTIGPLTLYSQEMLFFDLTKIHWTIIHISRIHMGQGQRSHWPGSNKGSKQRQVAHINIMLVHFSPGALNTFKFNNPIKVQSVIQYSSRCS